MRIILFLILLLNVTSYSVAQTAQISTSNEEVTLLIENSKVAAYVMLASGISPKETVILLHGLPGNERNLDIGQALRKSGKNVIFFNYRGSWGSHGEFLYSNCLEDLTYVVDYFSLPEVAMKYRIKLNSFILLGHSLGGSVGLLSGSVDTRVKKIIAISSFNAGGNIGWLDDYLKTLFMLNVNSEKFMAELYANKELYNLANHTDKFKLKPLLILDENNRNENWANKLAPENYMLFDTDHSFTNMRTEIIETILAWLE